MVFIVAPSIIQAEYCAEKVLKLKNRRLFVFVHNTYQLEGMRDAEIVVYNMPMHTQLIDFIKQYGFTNVRRIDNE